MNGKRIVDKNSHHTIIRTIQLRKGNETIPLSHAPQMTATAVSYTHRSIFCGDMEYPFPSGLYLSKIIQLTNLYPPGNPLLSMLRDTQFLGKKYAKEMSECMAMALHSTRCENDHWLLLLDL